MHATATATAVAVAVVLAFLSVIPQESASSLALALGK
jgi:hypothetical protein